MSICFGIWRRGRAANPDPQVTLHSICPQQKSEEAGTRPSPWSRNMSYEPQRFKRVLLEWGARIQPEPLV